MNVRNAARLLLIGAVATILYFAVWLSRDLPVDPLALYDKLEHGAAFFLLTVLARLSAPRMPLALIGIPLIAFGAGIEIIQGLQVIGRDSDIRDLLADCSGILLACVVLHVFAYRFRRARTRVHSN